MEKMLYVKAQCFAGRTLLGYSTYIGLEKYSGINARNKVVLRCNLSEKILMGSWLSSENRVYATAVCECLMGVGFQGSDYYEFAKWISEKFLVLVREDTLFKRKLEELYHFKFLPSIHGDSTFIGVIRNEFDVCYRSVLKQFFATTSAKGFQNIYNDGPYVWYSIDDTADNEVFTSSCFKQEVISNAKNWRHIIKSRD